MLYKLIFSIFPFDIFFHTIISSSRKTCKIKLSSVRNIVEFFFRILNLRIIWLSFLSELLRCLVFEFFSEFLLVISVVSSSYWVSFSLNRVCFIHLEWFHSHSSSRKRGFWDFHLIYFPPPNNTFRSLYIRRIVASLSLLYRYYDGHCSSQLLNSIPTPLRRACATQSQPTLLYSIFLLQFLPLCSI